MVGDGGGEDGGFVIAGGSGAWVVTFGGLWLLVLYGCGGLVFGSFRG